ncbi:hypothetical protein BDB01DRAFT_851255 [Pilobolus umbonatus]|nr:hypothetical protein BDB01DRAFT_851255 [Pilobolus umbonatus]
MKQYTVEVGPPQPTGGRIRRNIISKDHLVRIPAPGVHTLYDVMNYAKRKNGFRRAYGFRSLVGMIEEEKEITKVIDGVETTVKKTWSYFQMSGYSYVTYNEAFDLIHHIGAGYKQLGLKEKSKVEIFAGTSFNWLMTAHGLFTQNMTIVTAYDTLGEDGLLHSMNETEVEAIFTNADLLPTVAKVSHKCPTLKIVTYYGEAKPENLELFKDTGLKVLSYDEVIALGKENPVEPIAPEPEDISCIMYTSGSTGNPKGVVLSHKNIVAAVASATLTLGNNISTSDTMMAYLPLAHVFEFTVENACLFWGITLGYGSIRTLTDASVRNCVGDIKEFRPTLMVAVPAVWETIRKAVVAKIDTLTPKAKNIFNKAFAAKNWFVERHLPAPLIDKIAFTKIREQVGGRLRLAISGGAPLSVETQKFLSVTICPILNGYGMTESCSMCTFMSPETFAYGEAGAPSPCVELKLVDVPDAGYLSTNEIPQGEIWIRGAAVTKGYWKRDDITAETIAEGGWLLTGDIGQWNPNGSLTVIDRKKNLVKLSNGEYIALEKLESVYKSCMYVTNLCIYADSLLPRAIAVVLGNEKTILPLAEEKGIASKDMETLCKNEEISKAVLAALNKTGKNAGLKPAEILFDILLVSDEWNSDNGMLTAAQKMKRADVIKRYKGDLDAINKKQVV